MQIEVLTPDQLRLNPDNDRHGPLKDEGSAIQWLLENRNSHMRALAEDLANTKRLYEPPLVRFDSGKYVVFDGNRRMCCIKLFIDPSLAPSERWKALFTDMGSKELVESFSTITCEVEPDLAVIDEMLYRRHTGSQDGVGRSQWDPEGKSFFLQRTGKASVGLGEAIERALKAEQLISDNMELPWSNLERLFSSEPIRKRAGILFCRRVFDLSNGQTKEYGNANPPIRLETLPISAYDFCNLLQDAFLMRTISILDCCCLLTVEVLELNIEPRQANMERIKNYRGIMPAAIN